jgi:hypothetical protein
LTHIRIIAIGCKIIDNKISKSSFISCSSRLHRFGAFGRYAVPVRCVCLRRDVLIAATGVLGRT